MRFSGVSGILKFSIMGKIFSQILGPAGCAKRLESAQGLAPAWRVRQRPSRLPVQLPVIVCQFCFNFLRDKKKRKNKKEKKLSTGGSITGEKNDAKTHCLLTLFSRIGNFTSAPRTARPQPGHSQTTARPQPDHSQTPPDRHPTCRY